MFLPNKSLLTKVFGPTAHLKHFTEKNPDNKTPPVLLQSTAFLIIFGPGGSSAETVETGINCYWISEQFQSLINVVHSSCLTSCLVYLLVTVHSMQLAFINPFLFILSFPSFTELWEVFHENFQFDMIWKMTQSVTWKRSYNKQYGNKFYAHREKDNSGSFTACNRWPYHGEARDESTLREVGQMVKTNDSWRIPLPEENTLLRKRSSLSSE